MNQNEKENQRDKAVSASEASLDGELIGETIEPTDNTEGTADITLVETDPSADQADDFSVAQTGEDTDDIAESGTDWLIDTGLAAAINPQSDIPEEASEDRESDNNGQENAESGVYDDDDNDEDSWEQDESEDDVYEDDVAKSDDEYDFREDEQASLSDSDLENPPPHHPAGFPRSY